MFFASSNVQTLEVDRCHRGRHWEKTLQNCECQADSTSSNLVKPAVGFLKKIQPRWANMNLAISAQSILRYPVRQL